MANLHCPKLRKPVFAAALLVATLFASCSDDKDNTAVTAAILLLQSSSAGSSDSGSTSTSCSGSGPCKIFITNANATLTAGISGLDSQCSSDANKPSGGGTYKAMVADGTNRIACTTANCSGGTGEHTDWVLKPGKEYRRADGSTVIGTTTANGVFSFPLSAAIQTTVVGTNATVTGLMTDWTSSANDCTNFSVSGANTQNGLHDETSANLLSIGTSGCGNTMKIICVEQ